MRGYLDRVMVVAEAVDEQGAGLGYPELGEAAAATSAREIEGTSGKLYLCRVRARREEDFPLDLMLPEPDDSPGRSGGKGPPEGKGPPDHANPGGASYDTPAAFRSNRPDLWAKFGMEPSTYTDPETGEDVTVTPQIPVFL